MATSATGILAIEPAGRRRTSGFTLLELLVVLFIVGIVLGFAVLSVEDRSGSDRLQREAERLGALMDIAGEEAVLFGVELGLDLTPDGYRFLRLDDDGWRAIAAGRHPLRPRQLPQATSLRLLHQDDKARGRPDPMAPRGETGGDDRRGPRPEVLFLSSGETTPFELELVADGVAQRWLYDNRSGGGIAMRSEMPAGS